jgi:hypothetical protein
MAVGGGRGQELCQVSRKGERGVTVDSQGAGHACPPSAGAHLWLVRVQQQCSGNILAGTESVLKELPALGPVQVVLSSRGVVLNGYREVLHRLLELPTGSNRPRAAMSQPPGDNVAPEPH